MREGVSTLATFNAKETEIIKKRVSRGYASPLVVGRIYAAIEPDEPKS